MRNMRALAQAFLGLWSLTGCDSASSKSAVTALLRVENAQRVEGAPPALDDVSYGPQVLAVTLLGSRIWPGEIGKPLSGTLAEGSQAVSFHIEGDSAHYVLPAGAADVTAKSLPTFSAQLSFSPLLPVGMTRLAVQAVDAHGQYGPPSHQALWAEPRDTPQGALVIALGWERAADLDLHVEQPDGQELWSRRKSGFSQPRPGRPPSAGSIGYLDQDSNSQCVLDGQQREHVIYPMAPMPGRYRIRVDTFSLCAEVTAYWQVAVLFDGKLIASARGQSVASDTRGSHGQGSGTLALELDLR